MSQSDFMVHKAPCGCINRKDPEWDVMRSVLKCDHHKSRADPGGLKYQRLLGAIDADNKIAGHYESEWTECLEEMGQPLLPCLSGERALDVGAGVGIYAKWLRRLGYDYTAVEPDTEAAALIRSNGHLACCMKFEQFGGFGYDLIMASHVAEHFEHSPQQLQRMFGKLAHRGRLLLLVPDDADPVNADHQWFYTPVGIHRVLQKIGFVDIQVIVKRRIERELFLYISAFVP